MTSRTQKQLLIGSIYIFVALVIVGGTLYVKFQPTCNDGIKNGKEEGVDCGTLACGKACEVPVQALQIQSTQSVLTQAGDHDVAVQMYNRNSNYGVDAGSYDIVFKDAQGIEVKRVSNNTFYILPGQTKYLVRSAIQGVPADTAVSVEIKSVDWVKVDTAPQADTFVVGREAFTPAASQSTYEAVITNRSNFDFDTVDVGVVVFDSSGALIATNMTNLQTVLSNTDRSIKVTWPFALPADARVQVEVGTNIFNNANFLKTNGTQEKFQQYF